jgi:hypothetical protein
VTADNKLLSIVETFAILFSQHSIHSSTLFWTRAIEKNVASGQDANTILKSKSAFDDAITNLAEGWRGVAV